jgi:FAD:protein FMN transferase
MPSPKSNPKPSRVPRGRLYSPQQEPPQPLQQWSFEAIGTTWWIGIYQPVSSADLVQLQHLIVQRIEAFDKTYSRFRADSVVMQISRSAGIYTLPPDSTRLFDFYRQLYDLTNGLVTPLIGQVLSDVGYDATYSFTAKHSKDSHPAPSWEEALDISGNTLIVKTPVLLDFGAAGKGYLVDIVSEILQEGGIECFCVDAGGDMRCNQLPMPLRIGLEHPDNPTQAIGVASIATGALCGSAGNRRTWDMAEGTYHHIMNPQTLQSTHSVKAVWVAAADTLTADGLATALFFTEPDILHQHFSFAHCVIYRDNTVQCSVDFPAEIFS